METGSRAPGLPPHSSHAGPLWRGAANQQAHLPPSRRGYCWRVLPVAGSKEMLAIVRPSSVARFPAAARQEEAGRASGARRRSLGYTAAGNPPAGTAAAPGSLELTQCSRRVALRGLLLATSVVVRGGAAAAAADEVAAPVRPPVRYRGTADASVSQLSFSFELLVPAGWQRQADVGPTSTAGLQPRPLYGGSAAPATPLVARFASPDRALTVRAARSWGGICKNPCHVPTGSSRLHSLPQISVVVTESSKVKPTFLQCNSIADWGSPTDAAAFVLPRGAAAVAASRVDVDVPAPPRLSTFPFQPGDEGGEGARRTYFHYEFAVSPGRSL